MNNPKKPVDQSEDWERARRQNERSWGDDPNLPNEGQDQSDRQKQERTDEDYGTGKEGADPHRDEPGRSPEKPV
ncbi:MAG: hypothetical protein DI601_05695 [Azospirillum brasilense]|nr:MAG: hypothetical protein DI601_05695 [Azospirillum brasilense]